MEKINLLPYFINVFLFVIGAFLIRKYLDSLLFSKETNYMYINQKQLYEALEKHQSMCQQIHLDNLENKIEELENRITKMESKIEEFYIILIDIKERLVRLETILNGSLKK